MINDQVISSDFPCESRKISGGQWDGGEGAKRPNSVNGNAINFVSSTEPESSGGEDRMRGWAIGTLRKARHDGWYAALDIRPIYLKSVKEPQKRSVRYRSSEPSA